MIYVILIALTISGVITTTVWYYSAYSPKKRLQRLKARRAALIHVKDHLHNKMMRWKKDGILKFTFNGDMFPDEGEEIFVFSDNFRMAAAHVMDDRMRAIIRRNAKAHEWALKEIQKINTKVEIERDFGK